MTSDASRPVLAKPFGSMAFLEQVGRMLTGVQQG
jgi:hypothetical protein